MFIGVEGTCSRESEKDNGGILQERGVRLKACLLKAIE